MLQLLGIYGFYHCSYSSGVVVGEGLGPEELAPLAHEKVIPEGLALLGDAVLHAVVKVTTLGVAWGFYHTLCQQLLVLSTRLLMLLPRGADHSVDGLEHPRQPVRKP